jgi:hypothetical protein
MSKNTSHSRIVMKVATPFMFSIFNGFTTNQASAGERKTNSANLKGLSFESGVCYTVVGIDGQSIVMRLISDSLGFYMVF